jgi:hypothetical protein
MCEGTEYCIQCGEEDMSKFLEQIRRVRQEYNEPISNIFVDSIVEIIGKYNVCAPAIEKNYNLRIDICR